MSSWISFGASDTNTSNNSNTNTNTNQNFTGTQTGTTTGTSAGTTAGSTTPILSQQWQAAITALQQQIGTGGATPDQQTALDYFNKQLQASQVQGAVATGNAALGANAGQLSSLSDWWQGQLGATPDTLGSAAAKAAAGTPGYSSYATPASVSAPPVVSADAITKLPEYQQFYSQNLIDPSLAAYDYGTDRATSALDAKTGASGGFANERSGLAYSDLGAQSALGRGQLESQLMNLGLTNAAGLATGDVNRDQGTSEANATNSLAGQEFNSNQTNQRQQFDINQQDTASQMRMQAAQSQAGSILQQAGITQQAISNVVTANGVDMTAANALFQSGALTADQLAQLVQLAQTANGQSTQGSTTGNTTGATTTNASGTTTGSTASNTSGNTNTAKGSVSIGGT